MRALVFTAPNTLEVRDEPEPQANDGVIVQVAACGICGSDMHAYHGLDMIRRPPPLILGHEAAGTIASGPRAGERVTVNPLIPCGRCGACITGREHLCPDRRLVSMKGTPGAFAERLHVPDWNAVAIPDRLSFTTAALTEPFAVAYHAVNLAERHAARTLTAGRIAVLGGGAIGLATAHVLASRGVRTTHIAEPAANRRAALSAKSWLAPYDPMGEARPEDSSMDVVLDAYGARATREEACRLARPGGVIIHIGLGSATDGIDVRKLTLQEIAFVGSYCYTMAEFRETLAGLAEGRFGAIDWVEERPLEAGSAAFGDLDAGRVAAGKIVLTM